MVFPAGDDLVDQFSETLIQTPRGLGGVVGQTVDESAHDADMAHDVALESQEGIFQSVT